VFSTHACRCNQVLNNPAPKKIAVLSLSKTFGWRWHVIAKVFFAAIDIDRVIVIDIGLPSFRDEACFAEEGRRGKFEYSHPNILGNLMFLPARN